MPGPSSFLLRFYSTEFEGKLPQSFAKPIYIDLISTDSYDPNSSIPPRVRYSDATLGVKFLLRAAFLFLLRS